MGIFSEKSELVKEKFEIQVNYPPALYHKVLDYRVTEILLATLAIGTIVFFRLHR
jgi:hypothetical protein